MKVWDTFLFASELDMLECRLTELDRSPVYRHVLAEATVDHQGNPKPLYYADNRERFAPWHDKIIHLVIDDLPGAGLPLDPWVREHRQRMQVWQGLDAAAPEDLVLLADVDEIPSPSALRMQPDEMTALDMRLAMFAVDWVCPEPARVSVAGRRAHLGLLWQQRDNASRAAYPLEHDAGWHFTWLGGPEAIERKAGEFCHLELRDMILAGNAAGEWYEQGWTWHGAATYPPPRRAMRMLPVQINWSWPAYIRERRCPPSWFRPPSDT